MRFSIIVPIYNTERFLPDCIESVLAQTDAPDYELILVDDGSTDSSGSICDSYAARFGNIRVIHRKNGGLSNARNTGMAAAVGDYILFLDSDDLWAPDLLSTVESLSGNSPDMICYNLLDMSEDGHKKRQRTDFVIPDMEIGPEYLERLFSTSKLPKFYVWSIAFRHSFIRQNSLAFDDALCSSEDFDFTMAAYYCCGSVAGTNRSLYYYRERAGSLARTFSANKIMANLISKAFWYRRIPNSTLADLFVSQILVLALLPADTDCSELIRYISANADIVKHSTHPNYKLAKLFFRMFGYRRGAVLYCAIRDFSQSLHKGKN